MTRCYPVKSKHMNLHGDFSIKVKGIHVKVPINRKLWDEITVKKDLVTCQYVGKGKYMVIRVFKNKVNL